MTTLHLVVTIAAALVTILMTVAATSYRVGSKLTRVLFDHEAKITKTINDHQLSDNNEFSKVRLEIDLQGDAIRREFGDTGGALRQGLHTLEVALVRNEKTNLETFARRESMIAVNKEIADNLKELVKKVDVLSNDVASMGGIRPPKRGG